MPEEEEKKSGDDNKFEVVVQKIRKFMSLSLAVMGDRMGVSRSHFLRWEKGETNMNNSAKYLLFDLLHEELSEKGKQWNH